MTEHMQVAIALIVDQGQILVAWRDAQLHQGNCYEFPGGKVESGESPEQAVRREVLEETGLLIECRRLFSRIDFSYADRSLSLYFYRCSVVNALQLNPTWHWQRLDQLPSLSFPAANQAVLARLDWPSVIDTARSVSSRQSAATGYLCADQPDIAELLLNAAQGQKIMVAWHVFIGLSTSHQQQVFAIYLAQPQHYQPQQMQAYVEYNWIARCENLADALSAQRLGCDALICAAESRLNTDCTAFAGLLVYQAEPDIDQKNASHRQYRLKHLSV